MAKVLIILQWPLDLMICGSTCLYMYRCAWTAAGDMVSASAQTVCRLPVVQMLPVCSVATPQVHLDVSEAVDQETELAKIERMAVDHAAQLYTLLNVQSGLKEVILELAALDPPNRESLMSFSTDLDTLTAESIDVMQTMDEVLITNAWARRQLALIGRRFNSAISPFYALAEMIGLSRTPIVRDFEAAFVQYNDILRDQARSALVHFWESPDTPIKLENLVETMGLFVMLGGNAVDHQHHSEASHWKWVLPFHRFKMRTFERQASLYARLNSELLRANKILHIIVAQTVGVRARILELQDELEWIPRIFTIGDVTWSIEMIVARLGVSINYLDNAKQASQANQQSRFERFQRNMEGASDVMLA
ncbi:hypothetical protein Slin14017_G117960 [Septoria linicola]|nr:hypothetical protein Slin14017_G117960 [Septoria linicola]